MDVFSVHVNSEMERLVFASPMVTAPADTSVILAERAGFITKVSTEVEREILEIQAALTAEVDEVTMD